MGHGLITLFRVACWGAWVVLFATQNVCLSPANATEQTFSSGKNFKSYTISIQGDLPAAYTAILQQNISVFSRTRKVVRHTSALKRRIREDIPQIQGFLDQKGFCDASITFQVLKDPSAPGKQKTLSAILTITSGPRYTIDRVDFQNLPSDLEALQSEMPLFKAGDPFDLDQIEKGKHKISRLLNQTGYLFHKFELPHVKIDHKTRKICIVLVLETGPQVRFGSTKVQGLTKVHEDFVRHRFLWQEGEIFDETKLQRTKKNMTDLDLFSSVKITHGDLETLQEGHLPVDVELAEQPQRYVGAGLKYSQISRIGGRVFWGHHNMWGRGERLEISYKSSHLERAAQIQLQKPDFRQRHQKLTTTLSWGHDTTPAYIRKHQGVDVLVDRPLSDLWRLNIGGSLSYAKILNIDTDKQAITWGIPLYIRYDRTDQILDPSRGLRAVMTVSPYIIHVQSQQPLLSEQRSALGKNHTMLLDHRIRLSGYHPLKGPQWVWANWGEIAMMHGAKLQSIPADRRYYAGGVDSVRGYAFQKAEMLSSDARPQGGRMLLQWGSEHRFQVSEHLSAALFIEGAQISPQRLSPSYKMFYGYGAGVRYHTDWGPFRFDLAFPSQKRQGVDAGVQFYAGLGQAF